MRHTLLCFTLGGVLLISMIAALYLKSLPGSLVSVYYTDDIAAFNTPPAADMTACFDGAVFDYRIPFSISEAAAAELKKQVGDRPRGDMKTILDIAHWVRTKMSFGKHVQSIIDNSSHTVPPAARETVSSGLCDRYAQYFTAACQCLGIPARIIELNGHVVPEAFLRETGRWIMVDPTLGYYLTRKGVPLSVAEIIDGYRHRQQPEAALFASAREDDSLYRAEDEERLKGIYLNGFTVVSNQQLRAAQIVSHIAHTRSLPVAKLQYLDVNSIKLGRTERILRVLLAVNAAVCAVLGIILLAGAVRRQPLQ